MIGQTKVVMCVIAAISLSIGVLQLSVPAQESEWRIETVDSDGLVGIPNSIEVDSAGYPHISYTGYTNLDLKYAKWTGSVWNIEVLDSANESGPYSLTGRSSLDLDSSGRPHISYVFVVHNYGDLKYARWGGNSWSIETVDSVGDVGRDSFIVIDQNGHPHISYERAYHGFGVEFEHDLKYARWDGGSWNIEVIEHVDDHVSETSLALDSSGHPHISYSVRVGDDFRLKYTRWNGSAWTIETIDTDGDVGLHSSMALDGSDRPHIGYWDRTNGDLKYANWNGSAWNIEILDHVGDVGEDPSIALDNDDNPHISYYDATNTELRYAWFDGNSWSFEVVDSAGDVGRSNSLALDDDSYPHIGYCNITFSDIDLKYATKAELPPPPSHSVILDIDPNTLNLKSRGRWITAYLSAENASVHDIDISSILLQDTLAPERWDYQDDMLMLKFNRQALTAILEVGESVEITLSGRWNDGTAFEAYDYIRVISPGRWIDFP